MPKSRAEPKRRPWSDEIDPATIPDEVLKSERARRNALRLCSGCGHRRSLSREIRQIGLTPARGRTVCTGKA